MTSMTMAALPIVEAIDGASASLTQWLDSAAIRRGKAAFDSHIPTKLPATLLPNDK